MISSIMSSTDTDGDGKISKAELDGADGRRKEMLSAADANGDGDVTKSELTKAISSRIGGGGGPR